MKGGPGMNGGGGKNGCGGSGAIKGDFGDSTRIGDGACRLESLVSTGFGKIPIGSPIVVSFRLKKLASF